MMSPLFKAILKERENGRGNELNECSGSNLFAIFFRARELLESKMHQFSNDRATSQKRLMSMEDSNKQLQVKFFAISIIRFHLFFLQLNVSPRDSYLSMLW